MALLKYMKTEVRPNFKPSVLTPKDNEAAQISVAKAVSAAAERSRTRGQYNAYSNKQRAKIGKYAAENGATNVAKYYSATFYTCDFFFVCCTMVEGLEEVALACCSVRQLQLS